MNENTRTNKNKSVGIKLTATYLVLSIFGILTVYFTILSVDLTGLSRNLALTCGGLSILLMFVCAGIAFILTDKLCPEAGLITKNWKSD